MRPFNTVAIAMLLLIAACSPAATPAPPTSALAPTRAVAAPTSTVSAVVTAAPTLAPATRTPPPPPPPTRTPLPTATIAPTALSTLHLDERTVAWVWLPQPEDQYDTRSFLWKLGVPQDVQPGDVVAVKGDGRIQEIGKSMAKVYERRSGMPFFAQPISPTNRLRIVNPANGNVIAAYTGEILSPDARQTAAFVPVPSSSNRILSGTRVTNTTTGISRTFDIFDNYSLRWTRLLHGWGTHVVYGSSHDRWIHELWWFHPAEKVPNVHILSYGVDTDVADYSVNMNADLIAYAGRNVVLKNAHTQSEHQLESNGNFGYISISPNALYVSYLSLSVVDEAAQLFIYNISTNHKQQLGQRTVIFDHTIRNIRWGMNIFTKTSITYWSPDSKYLVLLTNDQPTSHEDVEISRQLLRTTYTRHALVFRASDGAQIADVTLPNFTGSMRLTNDLRLIMITYDGEQASLVVRDVQTNAQSAPIALGRTTPLIVYVPGQQP